MKIWTRKSNKVMPITICGVNEPRASLKKILKRNIAANTIDKTIMEVNIQ
jgi:hypothetical protein